MKVLLNSFYAVQCWTWAAQKNMVWYIRAGYTYSVTIFLIGIYSLCRVISSDCIKSYWIRLKKFIQCQCIGPHCIMGKTCISCWNMTLQKQHQLHTLLIDWVECKENIWRPHPSHCNMTANQTMRTVSCLLNADFPGLFQLRGGGWNRPFAQSGHKVQNHICW